MRESVDKILEPLIRLGHEVLRLSPNQISTVGFVVGIVAAAVVASGHVEAGLLFMVLSQIIDGVDGGVARRYGLSSPRGRMLETVYDRLNELTVFLALAYVGAVRYELACLAFAAILLVTMVEPLSKFDPGFKRFMLYFGWLATVLFRVNGFELALHVVFLANLIVFAVGTVMVDYRLQRTIDAQAILEREAMKAAGLPLPPDDPPTFLSKLFSWL